MSFITLISACFSPTNAWQDWTTFFSSVEPGNLEAMVEAIRRIDEIDRHIVNC